ncbi:MAG: cupredoxin domain-containing protein [Deinococcus sp.]|nr:cupredoxin domain-containing protein [Deinococcus sp.]
MRTRLIPPGGVAELVVQLPPGVYEVDCYVEDDAGEHDELGMENILTVREDAPLLLVSPPVAPVPAVSIKSFAFVPEVLEVKAGTVVVWTNEDPVPHTVVAEDGSFISQLLFGQNLSFSREFSLPGAYQYFCSIHPTMRAQVVVSP